MRYTRLLKIILENYEQSLSTEDYLSFEKHIHSMMNSIIRDLAPLGKGTAHKKRIQKLINNETTQNFSSSVTCRKNCSSYCHLRVEITSDDAAVILEGISTSRLILDETRLSELAKRPNNDEKWSKGVVPENRCLFLNSDSACSIYQSRPAACRKLMVTSDPNECAEVSGKILPVHMPKAEIIISAALNLPDNKFGSLATMLNESRQALRNEKIDLEHSDDFFSPMDL